MPDEVDLLETGGAVGHTRAREQRVHRTAALVERGIDRCLVREVDLNRLRARQRDGREVHHHDLGAGVLHERRDRGAHPGGAADNEDALAVVPKGVEQ